MKNQTTTAKYLLSGGSGIFRSWSDAGDGDVKMKAGGKGLQDSMSPDRFQTLVCHPTAGQCKDFYRRAGGEPAFGAGASRTRFSRQTHSALGLLPGRPAGTNR